MRRMIAATLFCAVLASGVAACGGAAASPDGGSGASRTVQAGDPGSPAGGTAGMLAAMRRVSQCVRSHGVPTFPDPVLNPVTNYPVFPDDAPHIPPSAQQACMALFSQLPAAATTARPPTAQYMRAFLSFARCVRSHGEPSFPDPNSLGQFPISGKTPALGAAMRACLHLVPGGGSSLSFVRAGSSNA